MIIYIYIYHNCILYFNKLEEKTDISKYNGKIIIEPNCIIQM